MAYYIRDLRPAKWGSMINLRSLSALVDTKAEQDAFYKRVGGGPVTVARPAGDRTKPTSPKQQQPSPAKPRSRIWYQHRYARGWLCLNEPCLESLYPVRFL